MPTTSSMSTGISQTRTPADNVSAPILLESSSFCVCCSCCSCQLVPLRTLGKFLRTVDFSFYYRDDTLLHLLKKDGEPYFAFEGDKIFLKDNIPDQAMLQMKHLVFPSPPDYSSGVVR